MLFCFFKQSPNQVAYRLHDFLKVSLYQTIIFQTTKIFFVFRQKCLYFSGLNQNNY